MRAREVLPGAAIAALLTASALLALLVGLGMRGDGPLAIDLGGSDGSVRLRGAEGQDAGGTGAGGRRPASVTLRPVVAPGGGAVAAPVRRTAPRRSITRQALQGASGRERAAVRRPRPALRTPSAPAPAPAATAPQPTATAAPAPVAVKVRGRGTPAPKKGVAKTRVAPPRLKPGKLRAAPPRGKPGKVRAAPPRGKPGKPHPAAPAPKAPGPPGHPGRVHAPAAPAHKPPVVVRVPHVTKP
jgi:hypothetical protein